MPIEVSDKRTADAIDEARPVKIAGGPHGITGSHTKAFDNALLEFLAKL